MKKIYLFLGIAVFVVLAFSLIFAVEFTPQGNINLRNLYNITNVPYYNGTDINITGNYYGNGSQLTEVLVFGTSFLGWDNLTDYPVACPSGTFLTQLNDSVTCTAPVADDVDPGTFPSGDYTFTNITADRINEVLYVQAGNGSDIQTKIDLCPSGGCTVIVPVGDYAITLAIIINRSNIILEGQGQGTNISIQNEGQDGIIVGSNTSTETFHSSVRNLRIIGKTGVINTGTSLTIKNHDYGVFENLELEDGDRGIEILALGVGGHNILNKFDNFHIQGFNYEGILIFSNISGGTGNYNNGQLFSNFYIHQNGLGVNITRPDTSLSGEVAHHKFVNGYIETSTASESLVYLENSTDNSFTNIMFDGTGDVEIFLNGSSNDNKFIGCEFDGTISDSGSRNIFLSSADGIDYGNFIVDSNGDIKARKINVTAVSYFQEGIISQSRGLNIQTKTDEADTHLIRLSPIPNDKTQNSVIDFFRNTNTTGDVSFQIDKGDGTQTVTYRVNASSGDTTLGSKITFALGEIIDNLVDGWIRITGHLKVTGMIQTEMNITTMTCNNTNAGAIYYNNDTNKHYGCNVTDWQELY